MTSEQEPPVRFQLADGIAVLERTPATLRALLAGLSAGWIPRVQLILAHGTSRRFEPYDRFAQMRGSQGKSLPELLDEFATWVAHDLGHVAQTARVMAKRYRDEVGPWRAYLPVLDR